MKYPIIFALLTALCWGLYGPVLGYSRSQLASPFKPYVAIGIAYLIWGVLGGLIGMYFKGDDFSFSGAGAKWGMIAGHHVVVALDQDQAMRSAWRDGIAVCYEAAINVEDVPLTDNVFKRRTSARGAWRRAARAC